MTTARLKKILAPNQAQQLIDLVDSQPSKFDEALDVIKGLWEQGKSFDGKRLKGGELESCIRYLPMSQYIGQESRIEGMVSKVRLLQHIGTDFAQKAVADLIADPHMNAESRLQIWEGLLGEATEFNLRCAVNTFSLFYDEQHEKSGFTSPVLREMTDKVYGVLIDCAEDEDNPQIKAVAIDLLYQIAEEGDIGILKYLFKMEEEDTYQNALDILKKYVAQYELEEVGILISRDEYSPNAVKAFFEIATKTFEGCEVAATTLFGSDIPEDEQPVYQKMIDDGRAALFEEQKNFQQAGKPGSYFSVARQFLPYFPEEAISMVGRQTLIKGKKGLTEAYVMAELAILDYKTDSQYSHHLVNVLITRGTNEALCMATDILEERNPHPHFKDGEKAEIAQQKKEIIDGLSRVIGYLEKEKNAVAALCKFINSNSLATDETAELAIMVLANRGSSFACSSLKATLEGMGETGKKSFALKTLIGLEAQNIFTYKCARQIANMIGGEAIATALAHFQKDGSDDAVSQIHHLQLDQLKDPFAEIKKLPRPQAISELTGSFNRFACNAMNALMDLREEALQSGANDVADYDAALKQGVKHLFDNKALLGLIRKGGETELCKMFVRLADTGVADKREQYNAALQVVTAEERLAVANLQYQLALKK